jgi:hypothetical protein
MTSPVLVLPQPLPVSGLYVRREWMGASVGGLRLAVTDTVRLDVDGSYPLMVVSGRYHPGGGTRSVAGDVDWFCVDLVDKGDGVWEGSIVRTIPGPSLSLPHTRVRVKVPRSAQSVVAPVLTLTFSGGAPDVTTLLAFESPYFRTAEFEFDTVETAPRVTAINPPGQGPLSITEVYSRAGVEVRQSPNASTVGLEAGVGAERWSDQQLHDAMQVYWSRYQPTAQWALWVLFAHRYRDTHQQYGEDEVYGIMFDSSLRTASDPYQRQGAAVFGTSIAAGMTEEGHPAADQIDRRRFFSAVHEIGHCFNLLHSWEKHLGVPWIPSAGVPDARALSFMNYPERVDGFFEGFKYRFDNGELYFIRHAPEDFVEMGGATAGREHGDRGGPRADRLRVDPGLARGGVACSSSWSR